jgi:5'(3')-deoxyribonucleotidase
MRIAIDIDSTLHHYWDTLSEIAVRRFGIELPYEEQFTWGITRLKPEQLQICIEESHGEERILAGTPYPGAVETVRRWHDADGHYIHVTSHRDPRCAEATSRWLGEIGLPFDDVCCSWEKVSRCAELGMDVLIDDSPLNLAAALERGIAVATIAHPWNRDVCEEEDVLVAEDWSGLARVLEPLLSHRPSTAVAAAAGQGMGGGAAN